MIDSKVNVCYYSFMTTTSLAVKNPPTCSDVALVLRLMTYSDLRDLARELSTAAAEREKDVAGLGGFVVADYVDWAELLVDWANEN